MATPTPAPKGGNILTRKIGPLPGWAWAAVVVGGFLIYRQRKAAAAAAAGTATTSSVTPTPVPASPASTPGYGYQGPGSGGGWGVGPIPQGALANTASSWTPPVGESQSGSGFGNAPGATTVLDSQGNSYEQVSGPQLPLGTTTYYQAAPGVFQPYENPGGNNVQPLAANTPLYVQAAQAA